MFGYGLQEERIFHEKLAWSLIGVSLPTYLALAYVVPSPWGKTLTTRSKKGECKETTTLFGPLVPARWAWFVFEMPNLLWSAYCWKHAPEYMKSTHQLLLSLFVLHYVHRAILYPLCLSKNSSQMPVGVVIFALVFTNCNGYLQAQSLCRFGPKLQNDWLWHPVCLTGLLLYGTGLALNIHSDAVLRNLRNQTGTYQIPYGGGFDWVSTPHYLGEMIQWLGFCMACQGSLAAAAFAIYTASNLIPRGVAHHAWYLQMFAEYPKERRAVIPFVL